MRPHIFAAGDLGYFEQYATILHAWGMPQDHVFEAA